MIRMEIYDGSLESPFRDICTSTISSKCSFWRIVREFWDLVWMHRRLRKGNTAIQRKYRDE